MRYSVIVPFKDEEENIKTLVNELESVMEGMGQKWEFIAINDGSTDRSLSILQNLCLKKSYLRLLSSPRNLGQSAALNAGFKAARGEWIITLDGDCQNDPTDIVKLIGATPDCDLVVGWRINRQDPWKKKIISQISNWIRSRLCRDGMHDSGCSLKIYRSEALKKIKMYHGMHRFLPALFKIEGFSVKEITVNHRKRLKGKTKYHFFNRSIGPILDMFVVYWMHRRALNSKDHKEFSPDDN
ncbi:MAG: glycosyltransferase family 2 protein [Chlamydiales bacterium]